MPRTLRLVGLLLLGVASAGCRDTRQSPLRTELNGSAAAPSATPSATPPPPVASAAPASTAPAENEVFCFRAYYGIGESADPARARACFEQVVRREKDFAGSSPSLPRIFLGLMLLDAQGGPRDRERGHALFADCLLGNDSGVSAAALERERSGATKPIDFCADLGGTTLDTNACAVIQQDREDVAAHEAVKEIRAKLALDAAGRALDDAAARAWSHFSSEQASYAGDAYRGGSMRIAQETWIAAALARERTELLRALLDAKAAREDAAGELAQAEASARAAARDGDNRKLLAAAEVAWKAYRAAEMAFVRRAYARIHGSEAAAARALDVELSRRRAKGLRDAVKALRGE